MKAKVMITVTRIIDLDKIEEYEGLPYEERLNQEIVWTKELSHEWMDADDAVWSTTGELIEDGPEGSDSTELPNGVAAEQGQGDTQDGE